MLYRVVKKILTFSALTVLGSGLLMVDLDSPTFISEAQACDQNLYDSCMVSCGLACYWWLIDECRPDSCDCPSYCDSACRSASGCF